MPGQSNRLYYRRFRYLLNDQSVNIAQMMNKVRLDALKLLYIERLHVFQEDIYPVRHYIEHRRLVLTVEEVTEQHCGAQTSASTADPPHR